MSTSVKLDLVLSGFTPDRVGLLTYILNHEFAIEESKVRELLGSALSEEVELSGYNRVLVNGAVDELAKVFHGTQRPSVNDIAMVLFKILRKIEVPSSQQGTPAVPHNDVSGLAQYIYDNWDEFSLHTDISRRRKVRQPGLWQRLQDVPKLNKTKSGVASPQASTQAMQPPI